MWKAWTNSVLGVWLAVAPFVPMDTPSVKINIFLVGAIIATVGSYVPKEKFWQRWLAIIIGTWLFITSLTPWFVEGRVYLWNNIISGVIAAISGLALIERSQAKKEN
jgi:sulfite exporter TauE/SafE